MRAKIAAGIDPAQERAEAKRALAAKRAMSLSFKSASQQFIAANSAGWKSAKHGAQWMATLYHRIPFLDPRLKRPYLRIPQRSRIDLLQGEPSAHSSARR